MQPFGQNGQSVSQKMENLTNSYDFRFILHCLTVFLTVFLTVQFVFNYLFSAVYVSGSSMMPTLSDGDYLFMDTDAEVERGDVVIIYLTDYNKYLIKRVIATEGDSLYCTDGEMYICYQGTEEFVLLNEPYIMDTWAFKNDIELFTVEEDRLYYLGDNRDNSSDSRKYGCCLESEIVGVVTDWSIEYKEFFTKYYRIFGLFA